MGKLTLWHNDCEWVVAESPEEATKVLSEVHGSPISDFDEFSTCWEPWPESKLFSREEPTGEVIALTGAEWAARGRAYIGSTEY